MERNRPKHKRYWNYYKTSKGNLSFQLSKLRDSGYIKIDKSFRGNYPLTKCFITSKGINAYQKYMNNLQDYFKKSNPEKED